MAKKYKILLGGKDLAEHPVTQNDTGKYYWNGSSYFKPVMAKFNNATLPSGYKAYYNGSHRGYVNNSIRHPWDISARGGLTIKMNVDVKIISATSADGGWVKANIIGTPYMLAFVHVDGWARVGSIVRAGSTICKIKTMKGSHLHIDEWTGEKIYNLIVNGDFNMSKVSKGKRYEFTNSDKLNVRDVPNGKQIVLQLPENKKVVGLALTDGVSVNNYMWNLYAGNGWAGWIADNWSRETTRAITDRDGVTINVERLEKDMRALEEQLEACKKENQSHLLNLEEAEEREADLRRSLSHWESDYSLKVAELEDLKKDLKKWEDQYATLKIKFNTLENDKLKIQKELDVLKQGRDDWINKLADILHKLFNKNN